MWLELALVAAFLTSFLPIVNKRLLADTPVSVVAWGVNALSLPLLGLVAVIAGIAPVFGFTAIGAGLVGYVSAIFKLSTVFSILWAVLFLKESLTRERLVGSLLMVVGAILTAT